MYEVGNFEGHEGIISMTEENEHKLNGEIVSYLSDIFPEPGRDIKRVSETNYYSVNVLNDEIDKIQTWYDIHLADANARGFVADREWLIHLNENVADRPDEDEPFAAEEISFVTNDHELFPDLDFDTAEGREDVMGLVNVHDDLFRVNIPVLYAKKTNFMGIMFYQSKLNKSIFTEAILPMTTFNQCELIDADFQKADLRYAKFKQSGLAGANFKDAKLTGANFTGSNWQDAINLADNPTFTPPLPTAVAPAQFIAPIAVNVAVPSVLKKLVKTQQKGKLIKDDVWQMEDDKNIIDAKNPKKFKYCSEKWTSRPRLIVSKAEYEMLPAEYADVDPTLVSMENEETDKGKTLGEDLLLEEDEDEKEPLKNFFAEQPDGFLFRVVQGEKFDDILVSNTIYQPTTSEYLRDEKDLILYTCDRPGSMGSANKNRPLIDIGKAIGMSTARIYVDFNEFKNIVLADTRKYKCYILYNDTRQSEQYQTLTSHNVLFNPGMNIVGQLHCNDGAGMSGVIWRIKPIGDNLIQSESVEGGKRRGRRKRKTYTKKHFLKKVSQKHSKKLTKKHFLKKVSQKHSKKLTKKHFLKKVSQKHTKKHFLKKVSQKLTKKHSKKLTKKHSKN